MATRAAHLRLSRHCAQIETVDWLHQNGVAHMDIKPANILLDMENGIFKLIDFGLSILVLAPGAELLSNDVKRAGSPAYTSPQILLYVPFPNVYAVDVWSCGIVVYEIVMGNFPYGDITNMHAYAEAISNGVDSSIVPAPFNTLCASLLDLDEVTRLRNFRAIVAARNANM